MPDDKKDILFRPWKKLKSLQERNLRLFVTKHLYPFSPYYRRLFDKNKIKPGDIKSVEDLKRIPFTSKKDLVAVSDEEAARKNLDFILQPNKELIKKYLPKSELLKILCVKILKGDKYLTACLGKEYRPVFLTATSGTTGQPISFLYTKYDLDNLMLYGKRIMEIFKVESGERAVNVFPYAPHLAFWQTAFAGFSSNLFILSTGGGKTLGTDGNIRSILKVKPKFLIGVPDYVYHILKTARDQGHKMPFLNSIALGASRVPKGFKRKIADILTSMGARGVSVLGTYGFTEARAAWAECPTGIDVSSGYHTYPDKEIFEVIDPGTGEVKREGEDGEIVYSAIDCRGSSVFRYRTGDLVRGGITYSPCPHCARTVPRISSDIVRASNVKNLKLSKIKGTLVNLNNLEHLLDDTEEIDQWQIEIVKRNNDPYEVDQLILHISLSKDVNKEKFTAKLNQKAVSISEISFNKVSFVSKSDIRSKIEIESAVKAKKIIDKRPKV
ncbi:MAG: AMP-binding protein [Omnitrophica bacterium]|nr:AMP-binding protein [Candidatus Omnitrophota bacterium]